MKIGAFHSQRRGTTRHHNNNRCPVGNKVMSTDRVRGEVAIRCANNARSLPPEVGMDGPVGIRG